MFACVGRTTAATGSFGSRPDCGATHCADDEWTCCSCGIFGIRLVPARNFYARRADCYCCQREVSHLVTDELEVNQNISVHLNNTEPSVRK